MRKGYLIAISIVLSYNCKGQDKKDDKFINPYEMAEVIGGLDSLYQTEFYKDKTVLSTCSKGTVYVQVKINAEAKLIDSIIAKGYCEEAEQKALKIVKELKFKSAKESGIPIESNIIIPVKFD